MVKEKAHIASSKEQEEKKANCISEVSYKDDALYSRAKELKKRLEDSPLRNDEHYKKGDVQSPVLKQSSSLALRLGSEFIAGIVTGALLGFGCDKLFLTKPWGLVLGIILGFCASILNILRAMGKVPASPFDKKDGSL